MARVISYEVARELKEGEKIAPQAQAVLKAIGSGVKTRAKTVESLASKLGESTQDPARVLAFYIPRLKQAGLVKQTEETTEKPAKPAKAVKVAKK